MLQLFINLLLTLVIAYATALFIVLTTGSFALAFVLAGVWGLWSGWRDARGARRERDGKSE